MTPAFASARASAASASSIACTHPRPPTTSRSGRGTKSASNNKEGVFLQPDVERRDLLAGLELDARVDLLQQPAREDLHVEGRRLAQRERVATLAVGSAPAPTGRGRPDLDQRIRHAAARTVEHATLEPERPVATRLVVKAEREEGPDGLRRRDVHSNGVERRTMSKRKASAHSGCVVSRSKREISNSRAVGSRMDWKIGSWSNKGSPGKYICVTSRSVN